MTKKIPLTRGFFAIVDDDMYEYLSQWKWEYSLGYAERHSGSNHIRMHRVVINAPVGVQVDHINANPLDNRLENLRLCTVTQNAQNRKIRADSKHGLKGVTFMAKENRWRARITVSGKRISLGRFDTISDAAQAYVEAAIKYFGSFARSK
jgi:hypothetical protein